MDSLETGFPCPSDMGTLVFLHGFDIPCAELFFYGESQAIWNYLHGEENLVPHAAGCLEFLFHEDFLKVLGITIFKSIKVVSSLGLCPYSCNETLLL